MSQMLQEFSCGLGHVAARGSLGVGACVSRQLADSGKVGETDRMRTWWRVWSYDSFATS
jgi:hypothetical protein